MFDLQLLDWTGRQLAPGKRGRIVGEATTCLHGLDRKPERWTTRLRAIGSGYWRVVGSAEQLAELALQIGQRWLKGLRLAERLGEMRRWGYEARQGEYAVGDPLLAAPEDRQAMSKS